MVQLQVSRDNFSIKLYFTPKGQTLPLHDFAISGMRTDASAPNPLNRKRFRESRRALLTNPKFYDLTLCWALGNTHQHLWGQTLVLQRAWTSISRHFISSCWHICWQFTQGAFVGRNNERVVHSTGKWVVTTKGWKKASFKGRSLKTFITPHPAIFTTIFQYIKTTQGK